MPTIQLKKLPNHFISSDGYVFKIENGNEVRVNTSRGKRNKRVYVWIEKKPRELLYLMMEYFNINHTPNDQIKYTVSDDLRINANSIIVRKFVGKHDLPEDHERLLYKFKCNIKAHTANGRAAETVSAVQVFKSLEIHNYRCVYCNGVLDPNTWHLDHFKSLSTGGKNVFENIVPSCGECNTMKGAMDGNQFYVRCVKISKSCVFAGKDVLAVFK